MYSEIPIEVDDWAQSLLADPRTKEPKPLKAFSVTDGVVDARVLLKNSVGYDRWRAGQAEYEEWEIASKGYRGGKADYIEEIKRAATIYEKFPLGGDILDVGGGAGIVREHITQPSRFVSVDPFITLNKRVPKAKFDAYHCLSKPLNFLAASAEFLPFKPQSFDWVHMRSVLDHVHLPDLALIEAERVLRYDGRLLIGLSVSGGRAGYIKPTTRYRHKVKHEILPMLGITRYADHHTWHPTFARLQTIVTDNRFAIRDIWWQPGHNENVCYILATRVACSSIS